MRSAIFTVTLSRPSTVAVSVDYTTVPKTAVAPGDFTASSGTITFAPGQIAAQIVIPVRDDIPGGSPEEFDVVISNPSSSSINDNSGACILPAVPVYSQPYVTIDNPVTPSL